MVGQGVEQSAGRSELQCRSGLRVEGIVGYSVLLSPLAFITERLHQALQPCPFSSNEVRYL